MKEATPYIEKKYDEIYASCEKGRGLLWIFLRGQAIDELPFYVHRTCPDRHL